MTNSRTLSPEEFERGLAAARSHLVHGDQQERRVERRLLRLQERWLGLAGALARLRPRPGSVRTIGVRPDGDMPFSVEWVSRLSDAELDFVLAHEAMHLERGTHRRTGIESPALMVKAMNIAHDAVINACLAHAMGCAPPAGGVWLAGAARRLPEVLALELANSRGNEMDRDDCDVLPQDVVSGDPVLSGTGAFDFDPNWSDAVDRLQGGDGHCDVSIAVDEYASMDQLKELRAKQPEIVAWGRPDGVFRPRGESVSDEVQAAVAQGLFASSTTHERTWSRPARRTDAAGEARRGRRSRGRELTVLLDTSASMLPWIEEALWAIRGVGEAVGVERVRLIQCDGQVTRDDELIIATDLEKTEIAGTQNPELFVVRMPCVNCGKKHAWVVGDAPPTRLDRGLRHLESEGIVSALVLTDGLLHAGPATAVDLTWLVFGHGFGFVPPSGRSVSLGSGRPAHRRESGDRPTQDGAGDVVGAARQRRWDRSK